MERLARKASTITVSTVKPAFRHLDREETHTALGIRTTDECFVFAFGLFVRSTEFKELL